MRAADNTIAFVKEWIEGKLTKRQYMHYYIVKTPHAQFLMKANEQPDLVAIKDHTGHIYICDEDMNRYHINHEKAQRNPFFALLSDGFRFSYSLVNAESFRDNRSLHVSKWKTLDRIEIFNEESEGNIHLSLIQIGEQCYFTETGCSIQDKLSLIQWANYEDIKKQKFPEFTRINKFQPYVSLCEVKGKPNNVSDIRGAYVEYAGTQAKSSVITGHWILIPTHKKRLNEVADENINAVLRSRPMAYNYGLTYDLVNVDQAQQRTEFPFFPEQLDTYNRHDNLINLDSIADGRSLIGSGHNWRQFLKDHMDEEMAENLIQFIDDDDAWLQENCHLIAPFSLGQKFKGHLFRENINGYILMLEENNPSMIPTLVAYIKGNVIDRYNQIDALKLPNFTKVLPAPNTDQTRQVEEFITDVCG